LGDSDSLKDVVGALKSGNFNEVLSQIEDIKLSPSEFEPYMFWGPNHYTRNCIAHNKEFELILLCWEEGQKTAIHCHDDQECWVKVLEGSFEETLYSHNVETDELKQISQEEVGVNEVTNVESSLIFHTLENTHNGRAMSLHLYMKPIEQCQMFNEKSQEVEIVQPNYYSDGGILQ
jgi:cysteine dioxygenase